MCIRLNRTLTPNRRMRFIFSKFAPLVYPFGSPGVRASRENFACIRLAAAVELYKKATLPNAFTQ